MDGQNLGKAHGSLRGSRGRVRQLAEASEVRAAKENVVIPALCATSKRLLLLPHTY
jgi:hypothetical protein